MSLVESKDVLIVDDDDAIRSLLRIAIRRTGLTCDCATEGQDALTHVRSTRYRVVLTDLMMPRMDGVGFVRELAALEQTSNSVPVVLVMTAFPVQARDLPGVADKVHAVLRKPFELDELTAMVRACVDVQRENELRGHAAPSPAHPCIHQRAGRLEPEPSAPPVFSAGPARGASAVHQVPCALLGRRCALRISDAALVGGTSLIGYKRSCPRLP